MAITLENKDICGDILQSIFDEMREIKLTWGKLRWENLQRSIAWK